MSGLERERAFLVRQSVEGRLGHLEASERLGINVRQFKRLVRAWRCDGDAGLVSRQRGRPSHRRMSEARRRRIGDLLRDRYADFGATLAAEKLLERATAPATLRAYKADWQHFSRWCAAKGFVPVPAEPATVGAG